MANVIVGIHGLSNKPERGVLADWWESSIREGLEKSCGVSQADFDFIMVYWADLLYKHHQHQEGDFEFDALYNGEPYQPAAPSAIRRYNDGWLDEVRDGAERLSEVGLEAIKRATGLDSFADVVLRRVVRDLYFYYDENRTIRDRTREMRPARQVLMDELRNTLLPLDGRRIMLIAHSMGSIIAYDVLRNIGRDNANFGVARLVTIGSPLGLEYVKDRVIQERTYDALAQRLRTPTIVTERWVNYSDRKDAVAIDSHLADDYGPNAGSVQVEDDLVLNDYAGPSGERNHHKSYGYLRTPELSEHIAEFIQG